MAVPKRSERDSSEKNVPPRAADIENAPPSPAPAPPTPSAKGEEGNDADGNESQSQSSAFRSLGWLDRFLALWIFLAMAVGIILGNTVPGTGPALQKGEFVGVSVPIGEWWRALLYVVLIPELARGQRAEGMWLAARVNGSVGWDPWSRFVVFALGSESERGEERERERGREQS